MPTKTSDLKFIDLFAGIGGTRLGFENACKKNSITPKCVFSSEIKPTAIKVYKSYFGDHQIHGDITQINTKNIPDFDFLLAGFPCQAFSSAGKRQGFLDTRGTLFFEVERILREKNPTGFILENVEGLVNHDKIDKSKKNGRTLETILGTLNNMGYITNYKILNTKNFGLAQNRKRIFIVGLKDKNINLDDFQKKKSALKDILENGLPTIESKLTKALLNYYNIEQLQGKAIKDKRGGKDNIHSWDIALKGKITDEQKNLLNALLKERRKKHWAEKKGIKWMDGMPLTVSEISTFFNSKNLINLLDDLVKKGYLKHEHPKELVSKTIANGNNVLVREYRQEKEKGYNIVAGKLSFEFSKILDSESIAPTLVATDLSKLAVTDNSGLRKLSITEAKRLFGFPDDFNIELNESDAFDLLGNTVAPPIIEAIQDRIIKELGFK
ncbi:MAG: DNA (cytosine-5-)-methyltransferase [Candidatus Diapherotrites archaeon CG11_big_fil_rev_8_21_14_0_20_37_9]|nr:MAG: DNA (cytosine-5-)-methyltransferase [Candidatus Diapherotrites archaeon CG11_big_fil_rev_8_21_14_0_20_37_9]